MDDTRVPGAAQIYAWIEEIFSWGIRRPGYPADRQAEDFAVERFQALGLENVRREPAELPYWEPLASALTIRGDGVCLDIPCFPLPHAAPTELSTLELIDFDAGDPSTVRGKAALCRNPLIALPPTLVVDGGVEIADLNIALGVHPGGTILDPRNTFAGATQVLPFPRLVQSVMEPAIDAGAGAFVGVLSNYPGDSYEYYVPYDGIERPIPGVWIRGSDGKRIEALLDRGTVEIQLKVASQRKQITSYNIIGELSGVDDELVVIGSHHDGPWASAVEDGSGISLVLAQALYWSRIPASNRPHRLMFLLNAGHMAGGAGCHTFIRNNKALMDRIVLEIHLEHAAREFAQIDGELVATGEPESRWFFTSRNPQLQQAVVDALTAEGVDRSLVIPPDAFGEMPTTDGGAFHPVGVPLVNYLTAPFYLFDRMDTLDKIHTESLVPITRATIRLVEFTTRISAITMRGGLAELQ